MGARPLHVIRTARAAALGALAEGHSRNGAAAVAGVSDQTLRNWMGADADFKASVEAAEREALAKVERVFLAGAMRDPRLALAFLERREAAWQRDAWTMSDEAQHHAFVGGLGAADARPAARARGGVGGRGTGPRRGGVRRERRATPRERSRLTTMLTTTQTDLVRRTWTTVAVMGGLGPELGS